MGFVPQDPYQSFNPVFTIGKQMLEILRWSGLPGEAAGGRWTGERRRRAEARLVEVMKAVHLPDPEAALHRYPHQFSGGQRQRILIAGALAAQPEAILADEPTTALDVTTQMQILRLLRALAEEFGVAVLFVSHDFGAVAQLCDRVSVMYAGQTVETGRVADVIRTPEHPYTRALLACHPDTDGPLEGIAGQVGSPLSPPPGCRFHPRCSDALPVCSAARPALVATGPQRRVACVHAEPA
jgi:oligopeptide/dipeptide ABC transporter ATP-binding protein